MDSLQQNYLICSGLRPNSHIGCSVQSRLPLKATMIGWPPGPRPSAKQILRCVALLAAGSYDRPCGLIESLFILSLARILDGRAQVYSSELSYSCMDHHLHPRVE